MSKEVGTPRYLSLVVPLKKVDDEAVHTELGDIMERAATTASSLEAEQDSGSGTRYQDTILGDVNAQTRFEIASKQSNDPPLLRGYTLESGEDSMKLLELMEFCAQLSYKNRKSVLFLLLVYFTAAKLMLGSVNAVRHMLMLPVQVPAAEGFAEMHNVVAFLEKPVESDGFAEIIDFLKASSVHYALTVNPIIYTSCIEQFWTTTKSSIRRDLVLDDAEGTDCLLTATIFEELDFSGRITPLFDTMMVQASEEVGEDSDHPTDSTQVEAPQDETKHEEILPTPSNDPQPSGEDSMQLTDLMVLCTKLKTQVLDLEKAKDAQAKEIVALKKRIQKLERKKMSRPTGLKRLNKVRMSRRVESSEERESLVAPEDASKQGRSIADINADVAVTLVDETQERHDDELMFDTGVLDTDEMPVESKVDEKDEQSTKLDDSTGGEAIKAAKPKVVTTATTTITTTRPKAKGVVVQESSEFRVPQEVQPSISKDKGKGIMVEPEVPLKRKDQIALDEQIARDIQDKLDAELIEEQKLARKQEEEANIALIESWENTQAMMEVDRLLGERLQ
ncbi:hypothetical protein Tco_0594818 [Tanacetum coccineum]